MSDPARLSFHEVIRDMAYSIIRVLNRDGEAVGPWVGLLLQPRSGLLALERLRFSLPCATA